ncbi:MAG TPA: hypothetical protein VM935_01775 [Chitinophagaceae bacterium]|jgi:hypothetical protein|nr:hypothetical protein [Chitinophagaceae bacterium]
MKMITLSALLLLATISFSSFIVSQKANKNKPAGVEAFGVHRQGKEISLIWSAPASSVSFKIERSEDGEFFNPIHTARSNGAKSYKFSDATFFTGNNYYRIVYINADGSEQRSAVQSIRIEQRG